MYLHRKESSRYYVIYSVENSGTEYADFPGIFDSVCQSLVCHWNAATA